MSFGRIHVKLCVKGTKWEEKSEYFQDEDGFVASDYVPKPGEHVCVGFQSSRYDPELLA